VAKIVTTRKRFDSSNSNEIGAAVGIAGSGIAGDTTIAARETSELESLRGLVEFGMAKRITLRLLAIALILTVCALGTHAVAHAHANAYDEQHCQVCHIGHAAVPQPAVQSAVQAPVLVARFALVEQSTPDLEPVRTLSIPRAPPA
jgi:hypothetical protein